jgi:hypothetical protein
MIPPEMAGWPYLELPFIAVNGNIAFDQGNFRTACPMFLPLKNNILSIQVKHSRIGLLNRKIGQPDTYLPSSPMPHPYFVVKIQLTLKNLLHILSPRKNNALRPLKNGFTASQKSFPLREQPVVIMIYCKRKRKSSCLNSINLQNRTIS